MLGSTLYAMETGEHAMETGERPAILRNMVRLPAGTTASAIYKLENGKFRVVIKDVSICNRRCITLLIWFLTNNALVVIIGNLGMLLQESVRDGWPGI
jgi:hypothetical protein